MRINRLHRKIVIEQSTNAKNSYGEWVSTWATFHTCFAEVNRFGGGEKLEAEKTTATNRVRFKIRFFDGITEDMRVLYDSKYYIITEIQELDREGLWLTAEREH